MINRGAVGKRLLAIVTALQAPRAGVRCAQRAARLGRDAANPKGDAELLRREREYLSFSSRIHLPASLPAAQRAWRSAACGCGKAQG